jgi:hypothetical protein
LFSGDDTCLSTARHVPTAVPPLRRQDRGTRGRVIEVKSFTLSEESYLHTVALEEKSKYKTELKPPRD